MKILLVNPKWRLKSIYGNLVYGHGVFPPLGLIHLTSFLHDKGKDVKFIDAEACEIDDNELFKIIEKENPDLVGLTCSTPTFIIVRALAGEIKKRFPKIKIVMGGVHPSVAPEDTIDSKEIDFAVRKEGEYTFLELMEALEKNKSLGKIKGLSYKRNGKSIHNPDRPYIKNLDDLPPINYDLIPITKYRPYAYQPTQKRQFMTIFTSRGCPYQCIFCQTKLICGQGFRVHSAKRVLDELENLYKNYGVRSMMFFDDTFTINKKRAMDICNGMVERGLKIKWNCLARVDTVDYELLKAMKRSGCEMIAYGVESGNDEILKILKKGFKKDAVRKAFRLTKSLGIIIRAFFIIGSPGETRETIQETVDFAYELDPEFINFGIMVPFPNSDVYRIMKERGMLLRKTPDWSDYSMFNKCLIKIDGISETEMVNWLKKIHKGFYLRPKYLAQRIAEIKSPKKFMANMRGAIAVVFS